MSYTYSSLLSPQRSESSVPKLTGCRRLEISPFITGAVETELACKQLECHLTEYCCISLGGADGSHAAAHTSRMTNRPRTRRRTGANCTHARTHAGCTTANETEPFHIGTRNKINLFNLKSDFGANDTACNRPALLGCCLIGARKPIHCLKYGRCQNDHVHISLGSDACMQSVIPTPVPTPPDFFARQHVACKKLTH
jgi:hypothetical protein